MSTSSPDRLPTSSETPTHVSAPVESTGVHAEAPAVATAGPAAGRSRSTLARRLTIGGVAGVVVVALGIAGVGTAGVGVGARVAGERKERDEREYEERERMKEEQAAAGNPSVDVARYYDDLFDSWPSDPSVMCLESLTESVMPELQAVVDGSATTVEQYRAALRPFVRCGGDTDFNAAMRSTARVAVSPSELDTRCAGSILETFSEADQIDALVTSSMDPVAYDQWVDETFAGCAV